MEDLSYTDAMVHPIKTLNLDDLAAEGPELEVVFAPLHFDDYVIKGNKLDYKFLQDKAAKRFSFSK